MNPDMNISDIYSRTTTNLFVARNRRFCLSDKTKSVPRHNFAFMIGLTGLKLSKSWGHTVKFATKNCAFQHLPSAKVAYWFGAKDCLRESPISFARSRRFIFGSPRGGSSPRANTLSLMRMIYAKNARIWGVSTRGCPYREGSFGNTGCFEVGMKTGIFSKFQWKHFIGFFWPPLKKISEAAAVHGLQKLKTHCSK